jgi:hypothetical protein
LALSLLVLRPGIGEHQLQRRSPNSTASQLLLQVSAYHLTSYSVTPSAANFNSMLTVSAAAAGVSVPSNKLQCDSRPPTSTVQAGLAHTGRRCCCCCCCCCRRRQLDCFCYYSFTQPNELNCCCCCCCCHAKLSLQVSAYHLTSYSVTPSATNFNGAGWASNMGAAKDAGALALQLFDVLQCLGATARAS